MTKRTVNDELLDRSVAHQVGLQRLGSGVLRPLLALLNESQVELAEELRTRLRKALVSGLDRGPITTARVAKQLVEVGRLVSQVHVALGKKLRPELEDLAIYEASFQERLLKGVIPIDVSYVRPSAEQLKTLVTKLPFDGRFLDQHLSDLAASQFRDVSRRVQIGVVRGQTLDEIVRGVIGTARFQFQDGVVSKRGRRWQVESVVRAAVNHVASQSREALYRANSNLISGVMWVATLDTRTTPVCQALDGKVFPLGSGERPPAHFACRSVTTPVVKSLREIGVKTSDVEPDVRAAMNGEAPARLTYGDWLRRQSAPNQDFALGRERGRIFRANPNMEVDQFVDDFGRRLTLTELSSRETALLDP